MIQLPQLHESLLIANERLVDRARRRARLFRTGMLSSVAAVSIGGAAVAGQALWGPVLGNEDGNRPTASGTPVPADQRELLGVLRREQTAADRGAAARGALAAATRQYRGIRLADVRLLRTEAGTSLVLIPVAGLRPEASYAAAPDDALCVATGRAGAPESSTCFSTDDVRRGRATGQVGRYAWGLVPDGVVAVELSVENGTTRRVPVTDNAFSTTGPQVDPDRREVPWIGAGGEDLHPEGAARMTLAISDVTQPPPLRSDFRDCGPDRGGVVPKSVACGAEARRWRPAIGEDGSGRDPGPQPTP